MFDERYAALRAAQTPKADQEAALDDHVFACVLAIGLTEEAAGTASLTDALGLSGDELARLLAARFPLGALPFPLFREGEPVLADEEILLRQLLTAHCARKDESAGWLVVDRGEARHARRPPVAGSRAHEPRRAQRADRAALSRAARRQRHAT